MDQAALLQTGHIAIWLLIVGLFFPRLALFLAWLDVWPYPPNPLPPIANFLGWLFVPRFLMAYYIYTDVGLTLWFWAYLILGIVGLFGESGYVSHRIRRTTRTTRAPDGTTTTTVEEEEI